MHAVTGGVIYEQEPNPMSIFPDASTAAGLYTDIRARLPRLPLSHDPGQTVAEVLPKLEACSDEELLGGEVRDPLMVQAVRAGLLLRADLSDPSHQESQALKTPEGSYWHGIMHRREPDYSNSKYWFRQLGDHPLFRQLADDLPSECSERPIFTNLVSGGSWDPFYFVDLCASCEQGPRTELREQLEELQALEMDALLAYCAQAAAR